MFCPLRLTGQCAPLDSMLSSVSRSIRLATSWRFLGNAAKPGSLRVLITGAYGQLGSELAQLLRKRHGRDAVVCTDIRQPLESLRADGPCAYSDTTDTERLSQLIVDHKINTLVHFAAILSAAGERNPELAMKVNVMGTNTAFELARRFQLRLFAPSTIGAFGGGPRDNTPDVTIMRPTTFYGVSKVYLELLGEWNANKYGIDFRCLRYPGIISSETIPGGGTTDYAVDIYKHAVTDGKYECYLRDNTALPMMYIPDCLDGTVQFLEAERTLLKQRVYNVNSMSFTPAQVLAAIRKHVPAFQVTYKVDVNGRQRIADSWPRSLDDTNARKDWGWSPVWDLDRMSADMLQEMRRLYAQ